MLVLGLTGGIGSGKSSAAAAFSRAGFPVIDADQVARDVIEPGTAGNAQLRAILGDQAFDKDGRLNRAYVRELAFSQPDILKDLEAVIHPLVAEHFQEAISEAKAQQQEALILEIPLLIEAGLQDMVDKIVVVDLPQPLQLERAMRRDGAKEDAIKRIMQQQVGRVERLRQADFVLDNSNDPALLVDQVNQLVQHLRDIA